MVWLVDTCLTWCLGILIYLKELSIIRLIFVAILWQMGNSFVHEIFIVGSLYYYVLIVIFVALEYVEKYGS